MDGELFSELRLSGKRLQDCEMALECKGNYRLYVDRFNGGFYAVAVEFHSCVGGNENIWDSDDLKVCQLFNVTAYFDGVRHLEFNREDKELAGYIYYPNMDGLISMLQKVREIEIEMCRDCDKA